MATPRPTTVDEMLSAQQRRRDIARLGAYAQHAKHDPKETTRGAFQARMRRYEEQVDPTGELKRRDPQALAKRVESALKEEMARVRLARTKRADDKRAALDRLRHTPSNHFRKLDHAATDVAVSVVEAAQLGAELTTLEDLAARHSQSQRNETASVEAEAAPAPFVSTNTHNFVSSDGGEVTVSRTPARRQTSTPKGSQKKAAKTNDSSKHSLN